ncbi:ChaN family lipoprotein [Thauera humireducens]|uniref:ChaN family lipoprotein n=1 Tax=Thauera humireducens TaxID=1134435 RepID=UPI0031205550
MLPAAPSFAAADGPACLQPGAWTALDADGVRPGAPVAPLVASMAKREVVLLGEQHDDADHHRWQLQMLAALHAQRPDMVIGFEMFPRRVQPVLDRWVAGELSERQFLDQVEWDKVWSMPAELYLPLFHFARLNRVPMVALNVEQGLTRSIATRGWDDVPEAEREGVGRAAEPPSAYVDFLFDIHREHARMRGRGDKEASRDEPAFRNFVESQLAWDRAMAEALVAARDKASSAQGVRRWRSASWVAAMCASATASRISSRRWVRPKSDNCCRWLHRPPARRSSPGWQMRYSRCRSRCARQPRRPGWASAWKTIATACAS